MTAIAPPDIHDAETLGAARALLDAAADPEAMQREVLAADDACHGVFVTASANAEISRALDRLMPRIRRLERLRFSSLGGRASVKQHTEILTAAPQDVADLVKQNWLSLGALIDRSFE